MNLSKTSIKVILVASGVLLVAKLFTAGSAVGMLIGNLINVKQAGAVGIIGGADGPTAIYVAGRMPWAAALLPGLLALAEIALLGFLFVKALKAVRKHI